MISETIKTKLYIDYFFLSNIKKYFRKFKILINGIWAIPSIFLIYILSPFIFITFCGIYANKIGHFIPDSAEALYLYRSKPKKEIRFFYFSNSDEISNKQWAKMLSRTIPTSTFFAQYIGKWLGILFRHSRHHFPPETYVYSRFFKDHEDNLDLSIKFLPEEDEIAKDWLKSLGWNEGQPFVCLLVRDSGFYSGKLYNRAAIESLDYRDSDISTFLSAIKWLNESNVFVLRMGTVMKDRVAYKNKYFIDYAFLSSRSDLLDIWLFANCNGIISSGSGLDQLGVIYKKPIMWINHLPLFDLLSYTESLTIPKHLKYKNSNKPLTLKQILFHSCFFPDIESKILLNNNTKHYQDSGIQIITLDESEILEATKEFWNRIRGTNIDSVYDIKLQQKFWDEFKNHENYYVLHNWKHPKSYVGKNCLANQIVYSDDFLVNKGDLNV